MKSPYFKNVVTLELSREKCIGCKKCLEVCPHAVFKFDEYKASIINKDRCMECGACAKNCPVAAIYVKSGIGCAIAIINEMLTGEATCDCSGGSDDCC